MPTGYTAYIENGTITEASDFLMLCARAFGACIDMRDEPLSKPIPKEFKPETYYMEYATQAKKELARYQSMSLQEAQQECDMGYADEVSRRENYKATQAELLNKYNEVLKSVKDWEPPTREHYSLKRFAIEQIEMCLPDPDFYDSMGPIKKWDAVEWLTEHIDRCKQDVERYTKRQEEENERVRMRNEWLRALRNSL